MQILRKITEFLSWFKNKKICLKPDHFKIKYYEYSLNAWSVYITHKQTKEQFHAIGKTKRKGFNLALKEAYNSVTIRNWIKAEEKKLNKRRKSVKKYLFIVLLLVSFGAFMDINTYIYRGKEDKAFIAKLLKSRKEQDHLISARVAKLEKYIGDNNIFGIGQGEIKDLTNPSNSKIDGLIDNIPETWTEQMVQNLIINHGIAKYKLRNSWLSYPVNVATGYVCSGMAEFGVLRYRKNVYGEYETYIHTGLDIGSATDTEVLSASTGIVSQVGYDKDGGNFVIVETVVDNVVYHICYFHIEEIQVKERAVILQGSRIGIMGQTGELQTGRHLHFEIRKDGVRVNPVINSSFNKIVVAKV